MSFKKERTESIIQKLAAEFLEKESGPQSLITVTHVSLSENGKTATIFFSVLPYEKSLAAFEFISRQASVFKEYFKKRSNIQNIPFFKFQIDSSSMSQ